MPRSDHPRHVSDERLARLSHWARAKPRIGLMGEFSSGKSTLLNLLIGEDVLPTKVTATELPPVWFSHGEEQRAYWIDRDGRRHPLPFGDFRGVPMAARCVRVFTPSPMLERCDIIDTPGISDPNLAEDSWRFAVGQSNFILWCTTATQAWRETERSTWLSLPTRLRDKSVLVVTRADKLAGPNDREKVMRRLMRETLGLFGGLVMLSSVDAVRGQELFRTTGDMSVWDHSGGRELDRRIEAGLKGVSAERLDLLDRYVSTGPEHPLAEPVLAPEPAPVPQVAPEPEAGVPAALLRLFGQPEPAPAPAAPVRAERPAARSLWIEDEEDQPLVSLPAEPDPTPEPEPEPATEASVAPDNVPEVPVIPVTSVATAPVASVVPAQPAALPLAEAEPDPVQAVLAAMAEAPPPRAPVETLPNAVRIWRDIVARASEVSQNDPVVAMIDQLLFELSRDGQLSATLGPTPTESIEQDQAA
ncbi:dynamin family protein [Rubellimicrobium roseum]|uniref:Dynamin N-terminal domain-containing protein n=1 Tax=Rubellimicrobium roseum TaxID=687525 RepID=A0A5C4NAQ9_9RHOB|nr:dynamin family protein [Rubellimicrobium roseum]TNC65965.1 hypothetical protein FHG71_16990 [Rubellimicrobium roseum]